MRISASRFGKRDLNRLCLAGLDRVSQSGSFLTAVCLVDISHIQYAGNQNLTARAHAEIISVRNKWFETCEDVLKEKEVELARKDRELKRMEEKMLLALRQRDEALYKCKKKNLELYDVKTGQEETLGELKELTARANRDYTNSSTSSSMSPNHKKIQNGRGKTERKPGGQPGRVHCPRRRQEHLPWKPSSGMSRPCGALCPLKH